MIYASRITRGKGRGKGIGFPTLNFVIPHTFPYAHGIYGGLVTLGSRRYRAAFHYGPIPTFKEHSPSLEAFLLNANLHEYPKKAHVELLLYLRRIRFFETSRSLAKEIARDVETIRTQIL